MKRNFLDTSLIHFGGILIVAAVMLILFTALLPSSPAWEAAANMRFASRLFAIGAIALLWGSRGRWEEIFALWE